MSFDPSLPRDGVNVSRTHPLREAALLIAVVAAAGALCVVVIATAVDWLVPKLPPGLEARLFASAWPAAVGRDADDAEEATRAAAAQQVLQRLARHWSDNPYALRLGVMREDQPNAFALPGGSVVLTSGLLERVESENELAFVLGHELGHFHHRDHLRGLGRGLAFALVMAGLGAGGAAADVAALGGQLAQRGFDRDQERAADRFALELLAAEYGHVAGVTQFFGRLPAPDGAVEEALTGYLATHPLHEQRVEALQALAEQRGWPTTGALRPVAE